MPISTLSGETSEQNLIAAWQEGRPEALSLLYDKYAPVLMGLISRMIPNPVTAELVLQKTFAAIWFKRATYDAGNLRFLSWIILIARDIAKNALSGSSTKGFSITEENCNFTLPTEAVEALRIKEFCGRLTESEKKALELVYLKGYSCEMAAASMGLSLEALKTNLKTAIKQLGTTSNA